MQRMQEEELFFRISDVQMSRLHVYSTFCIEISTIQLCYSRKYYMYIRSNASRHHRKIEIEFFFRIWSCNLVSEKFEWQSHNWSSNFNQSIFILTLLKFDANKMSKLKLPQNNYKFAERSNQHMNAENHIVDEWVKCGWRWIKFFLTWDLLSGSSSDASLIHAFFKSFFLLFDHFISVIFGMREII